MLQADLREPGREIISNNVNILLYFIGNGFFRVLDELRIAVVAVDSLGAQGT
jgi:hypothetical protein